MVKDEVKNLLPKEISDFSTLLIESTIAESYENVILLDKMQKIKSYQVAPEHKELYDGLVKSYNVGKALFEAYGNTYSLKRDHVDKDKDKDPSVGSDRGSKRRKTSKDDELSKEPKSNGSKSLNSSKGTSHSLHKSTGKSTHAEEPIHALGVQKDQEFETGINDDQSYDEAASKQDWLPMINMLFEESHTGVPKESGDYGYLKEIVIRREDQQLYKFKEEGGRLSTGSQKLLEEAEYHQAKDIQIRHPRADPIHCLQQPLRNHLSRESRLDRTRSCIMIKAIDEMLFEKRLMRNLERFVGGREYGNDFRLLERAI
ncbi:hypothetical protein Tco_0942242 [Tanacetum coccineum]